MHACMHAYMVRLIWHHNVDRHYLLTNLNVWCLKNNWSLCSWNFKQGFLGHMESSLMLRKKYLHHQFYRVIVIFLVFMILVDLILLDIPAYSIGKMCSDQRNKSKYRAYLFLSEIKEQRNQLLQVASIWLKNRLTTW